MAAITLTTVSLVETHGNLLITAPTADAFTKGQYGRLNTTSGKMELGNGSSAAEVGYTRGIIINTPPYTGAASTFLRKGLLDLGDALDALAFDAPVYLSDTDGTLATTAGESTQNEIVGRVVPGWATTNDASTPDKLLYIDVSGVA